MEESESLLPYCGGFSLSMDWIRLENEDERRKRMKGMYLELLEA